ncbi:MAG: glutaminase [Microbacteriaceae bacterium]|nr:glutaminase [Microbacteriaceae bacterium]
MTAGARDDENGADAAGRGIPELVADAVARLRAADARDEGLGRELAPRRFLGLRGRPRIARTGRVWRLGVLLLGADGSLYATGGTLRARAEVRRGYTAESARLRAEQGAAARRGGFAEGDSVNIGWRALDASRPDGGILRVHDGTPQVRWNPRDPNAWSDLAPYLRERIELLLADQGA